MSFPLSALQKGCELTLSVLMSISYINIVDGQRDINIISQQESLIETPLSNQEKCDDYFQNGPCVILYHENILLMEIFLQKYVSNHLMIVIIVIKLFILLLLSNRSSQNLEAYNQQLFVIDDLSTNMQSSCALTGLDLTDFI